MEIRAVALSTVAIKGERSGRYLCMGADGKMQGQVSVSGPQEASWDRRLWGRRAPGLESGVSWLPPAGMRGAVRRTHTARTT